MVWAPLIAAGITAAGSIAGGMLSKGGNKETKMQRTSRKLVDSLLASLQGNGPYSDLFTMDKASFEKSVAEPAQSRFTNKIAPQIQQQYIASGQQRSSGLEDQLLRAGVDMNSLINEQMGQFQQGALNRKQAAISSIFGVGPGAQNPMSSGEALRQSTAGYLASPAFGEGISSTIKGYNEPDSTIKTTPQSTVFQPPPRKGFEPEYASWGLGDARWGQ